VFLSDGDFHPAVGAHFQAHGGTASVPSHLATYEGKRMGRQRGRPTHKSTMG
jgi:hypothetical protein